MHLSMPGFGPSDAWCSQSAPTTGRHRGPALGPVAVVAMSHPKGVPKVVPAWARRVLAWEHAGRPKTRAPLAAWYAPWAGRPQHPDRAVRCSALANGCAELEYAGPAA